MTRPLQASQKNRLKMKMNILAKLALCCLALQAGEAGQKAFAQAAALNTEQQKTSYALGVNIGTYVKGIGVEMDADALVKGMKDTLAGGATLLTSNEVRDILTALPAKIAAKKAKEGDDFLAKNKAEPGVITLTNGLQYKIITAGTGPIPKLTDTVNVHYRGTFVNGELFQDSGTPVPFQVSQVIPGWTQILQLMPTGSKWRVFIPSNLAYGPNGRQGIPANSVLIFEMELVSIQPAK